MEWVPQENIAHGHIVTDTGKNMLLVVGVVEGNVSLVQKFHLVVMDAVGHGSNIKPRWDKDTLETCARLDTCQHLTIHYSHSIEGSIQASASVESGHVKGQDASPNL